MSCVIFAWGRLKRIYRYEEIRNIQVKHLLSVWLSGIEEESNAVRKGLEEKIDGYAAGELKHAADAISCIWEISNKEDLVLPGSPSSASHSNKNSSISTGVVEFAGCSMRLPLIRSIREGSLFDRKYWARKSREGLIGPIYFSSAVVWADVGVGESLNSWADSGAELRSFKAPLGM